MIQFSNHSIRVGRLLELMDYIAANVAYRYCTPNSQKVISMDELAFLIVTAAIDEIDFFYPVSVETDCTLAGYVTYVGKSSIEVHIDVLQIVEGEERIACTAKFVMVARDKITKKAFNVPPLQYSSERSTFRIVNELGFQRQKVRKN